METKRNTKAWTAKEEKKNPVNPGVSKIHNLIIVDESGSMYSLYNAALNGMNETIRTIQNLANECPEQTQEVTLITFDTSHYKTILDSAPASKARELTHEDYHPSGGTPLYDALGKALNDLEPKVKENEAVLVTVITDGYENASCEYSLADIKALVERLDKAGWLFSYIGANQDSAAVGNSMGIKDTLDFNANEDEMKMMWTVQNDCRREYVAQSRKADFSPVEFERGSFFKRKK